MEWRDLWELEVKFPQIPEKSDGISHYIVEASNTLRSFQQGSGPDGAEDTGMPTHNTVHSAASAVAEENHSHSKAPLICYG